RYHRSVSYARGLSITPGRKAGLDLEIPIEVGEVVKTGFEADIRDRHIGLRKHGSCAPDAYGATVSRKVHACQSAERARKSGGLEPYQAGHLVHGGGRARLHDLDSPVDPAVAPVGQVAVG